jgi:glycosyltransferase involved in cell wall biosynthesis
MRIAFILPSLDYKAPILVVRDIVAHIKDEVDLIDVYYFKDIVKVKFDCPVHHISFNDEIDFDNYDIIHSHLFRPDMYIWKNRKDIKSKKISTVHCHIREGLRYEYNVFVSLMLTWVWLFFLRTNDKVVVLTKSILDDYYKRLLPPRKLTYIYNGIKMPKIESIDIHDTQLITQIRQKNFKIIGANAGLTKIKGLNLIIATLPFLPEYSLIVCGDGKERRNLENLARKLNVANRCYFLGFRQNAVSYLPFYDVYAMPSISEGFSLALIEATFLKRSCVCSDIPIFREIFTDDEVTFFSRNNKHLLKDAIEEAYAKRSEKGNNAYIKTVNNYTASVMGNNYLNLYRLMAGLK